MILRVIRVVAWLAAASSAGSQPNQPRTASTRQPIQWGNLEPGPYDVGFRRVAEYDYSRRVGPTVDFEGRPNPGPLAMSMPVAVWYPAKVSRNAPRMQYGLFAALGAKRTDLTPVTLPDRRAALDDMRAFAGFAFGRQIPESLMRAVDTTQTAAVQDATPVPGRFPVVLAETDGSVAAATVLFEYLASRGMVVMAVPSRLSYATLQVSRPNVVVEARVRDFELLLDHTRRHAFIDTSRIAALGVNFDGMAALAFQMKNMATRAVVSLDGWEGKANSISTVTSGLHYDPRRFRVPYFVVLQDEQQPPPALQLDRTVFDAMRYSARQWLVLRSTSHAYLVGNPLVYPDLPSDKRNAYELLIREIHGFLDAALLDGARGASRVADDRSPSVKELVRTDARRAVPDDTELERLIMVDRAVDKVTAILREARQADSSFVLFSQQTMALYAFRFTRRNDLPFAIRLLELNAEAYPRSWSAADALGDGYRDSGDTTRALAAYARAKDLLQRLSPPDSVALGNVAAAREGIDSKIGKLRPR